MKSLSLIFPCYNEAPVFRASVERTRALLSSMGADYEIIFVDDCSTDGTQVLIRQELASHKDCSAIFHEENVGRGGAVADGIRVAKGKIVGYLDIDLEVSPVYVFDMLEALRLGSDAVCAYRHYDFTVAGLFRNLLHDAYSRFASIALRLPVSDPNAGCKFFVRRKIMPVLGKVADKHWFWDTEIMKRAEVAGLRIAEVPVLYLQNREKRSSVRVLHDTVRFLSGVMALRAKLKAEGSL